MDSGSDSDEFPLGFWPYASALRSAERLNHAGAEDINRKSFFKFIKVNKIRRNIVVRARSARAVKIITDCGAFIEIKEGVDGLIHVPDMCWINMINHPSEVLKKGDKVECIVMAIDK